MIGYNILDEQCLELSRSNVFSYQDIFQAKEILSDIKRLKIYDMELTDEVRVVLLNHCIKFATAYACNVINIAMKFWQDSEKYSDELKEGIAITTLGIQEELKRLEDGE